MNEQDRFRADPLAFLSSIPHNSQGIQRFKLGSQAIFLLDDPQHVHEVLVDRQVAFQKVLGFSRARKFVSPGLFRRSIDWASALSCRDFVGPTLGHADTAASEWLREPRLDLFAASKQLSLRILADTVCAGELQANSEVQDALDTIINTLNDSTLAFPELLDELPSTSLAAFETSRRHLFNALAGHVTAERRDLIITSLLAGYEQVASVLVWIWTYLAEHEQFEVEFFDELDRLAEPKDPGRQSMPVTESVINETLRLMPPVWVLARVALSSMRLGAAELDRGDVVMMSQFRIHRSSAFYSDPAVFDPHRWRLEKNDRPKFAFFPFGHGVRGCKGERLVRSTVKLVLLSVGRRARVRFACGNQPRAEVRITLRPAAPAMGALVDRALDSQTVRRRDVI